MKVVVELFMMRGCSRLDKKDENKELEFIKEFNNIKTTTICKEKNIDKSNLYKRGRNAKKIKKEIDKRLVKLYSKYIEGDVDE